MFARLSVAPKQLAVGACLLLAAVVAGSCNCDSGTGSSAPLGTCFDGTTTLATNVTQTSCESPTTTAGGICPVGHTCYWSPNSTHGGVRRPEGDSA